jgi:hypothetical protein
MGGERIDISRDEKPLIPHAAQLGDEHAGHTVCDEITADRSVGLTLTKGCVEPFFQPHEGPPKAAVERGHGARGISDEPLEHHARLRILLHRILTGADEVHDAVQAARRRCGRDIENGIPSSSCPAGHLPGETFLGAEPPGDDPAAVARLLTDGRNCGGGVSAFDEESGSGGEDLGLGPTGAFLERSGGAIWCRNTATVLVVTTKR